MTLYELSLEYEYTAAVLRRRIRELERTRRETADEGGRLQLDRRIRPLRSMYRDVLVVARHLERYYERRSPRRTGRAPTEHGRRA